MAPIEVISFWAEIFAYAIAWEYFRITSQDLYWKIKRRMKYLILGRYMLPSYYG